MAPLLSSPAYLEQNRVPTVLVDRLVSRRFNQVGVENKRAIKELVEHLYNPGHRRIAMIAGRPHAATTFERVDAYKRTLRDHSLPVDEALIHDGSEEAESFHHLLTLKRLPTAILAENNRSIMRLMQYLHTTGLRVPRECELPWVVSWRSDRPIEATMLVIVF